MAPAAAQTLKPLSKPLMDSGSALARSGELLIDMTRTLDLYGGALSSAGAQIRNAGDCVAQAAATCRFKTGVEVVIDELREAATCLGEAADSVEKAQEEALADTDPPLQQLCVDLYNPLKESSRALEKAGASILLRKSLAEVGTSFVEASTHFHQLSVILTELAVEKSNNPDGILCGQRMEYASTRLYDGGMELRGGVEESKKSIGRAFLKGM